MNHQPTSYPGEDIFVKVIGVKVEDVPNWSQPPASKMEYEPDTAVTVKNLQADKCKAMPCSTMPRTSKPTVSTKEMARAGERTDKGYLVEVNNELIALFKVKGKMYAVRDSCPHAGGPLSVGDIEELPGEGFCVRCPWHQWTILLDSGKVGEHRGREQTALVYPVKVNDEGDIFVGVKNLSQDFFNLDLHPATEYVRKRRKVSIQYGL